MHLPYVLWFTVITRHTRHRSLLAALPFSALTDYPLVVNTLCKIQSPSGRHQTRTTLPACHRLDTTTCNNCLEGRTRLTSERSRGRDRAPPEGRRALAAFRPFRDLSGSSMWSTNSSGRLSGLILNAISFTLRCATPRTLLEPGRGQRCRTG